MVCVWGKADRIAPPNRCLNCCYARGLCCLAPRSSHGATSRVVIRLDLLRAGILHLGVAAGITLVRVLVLQ